MRGEGMRTPLLTDIDVAFSKMTRGMHKYDRYSIPKAREETWATDAGAVCAKPEFFGVQMQFIAFAFFV